LKQRNTLLKITMCVLLLITVIIITEINSTFRNVDISTKAFGRTIYIAIAKEEAEPGIDNLNKVADKKQDMTETMNPEKGSYLNLGNRLPHKEVFDLGVFTTVLAIWLLLFITSLLIAKKNQLYVKIKEGSNKPD
jgi:hypothetical protein